MTKIDFKQTLKELYRPRKGRFERVLVPPLQYLMIDGHGDPNVAAAYRAAVEALYAAAYRLKFMSKTELNRDYVVPPLEGLWWAEDMAVFDERPDKSRWDWTMMILTPDWITADMVQTAVAAAGAAKDLPALPLLRLETYDEGLSVQFLHIGPYDAEGPAIAQMHNEYMPEHGLQPCGKHHEIYLSDPRRVAAEQLKTVVRQPVESAT